MKKKLRIIIDVSMTALLPLLMAYSLIGEKLHEIIGTVMLILIIGHQIMNRHWYKALFKGKYPPFRVFQTALDILLLVFMLLQPLSGILMSKYLYTFINVPNVASVAREIHLVLAYWGFALMCMHAGTHFYAPLKKLRKSKKNVCYAVIILLSAVSVYGAYAFVKRQLWAYMFLKSSFVFFDFSEAKVFFFLDYIAIMILFAFVGMLITYLLTKAGRNKVKLN